MPRDYSDTIKSCRVGAVTESDSAVIPVHNTLHDKINLLHPKTVQNPSLLSSHNIGNYTQATEQLYIHVSISAKIAASRRY